MTNRVYDFTLGAAINASARVPVPGSFVLVISAPQGPVGIKVDGGAEIVCNAGQGVQLPPGSKFSEVLLRNQQAVAFTGSIFIGDDTFIDRRITGTVEVVDGGRARSLAGVAGVMHVNTPAVAANLSHAQLWNDSSTLRIVVKALYVSSAIASLIGIGSHNAALATLSGTPVSKRLQDGSPGAGQGYLQNNGPGLVGTAMWYVRAPANQTVPIQLNEPYILKPGTGLIVFNNTVNQDVTATFEFFVEPNT